MSGLPVQASLGAGTYFFAVLVPGGQHNPNEAGAKNLSDTFCAPYSGCTATTPTNLDGSVIPSGDLYTQREFTINALGHITTCPTNTAHTCDQTNDKIRVFPYDDTTNPGGVYILAVCRVPTPASPSSGAGAPGADPSLCKYDAFKVETGETTNTAHGLAVEKTADASIIRTFSWDETKAVNRTTASQTGGIAQFNYTVDVTPTGHSDVNTVSGTITVTNPNSFDVNNVVVSDVLNDSPATNCTVQSGTYTDGNNVLQTVASGDPIPALTAVDYAYSCSPTGTTSTLNTATASWDQSGTDPILDAGSTPGTHTVTWGDPSLVHACVNATDALDLGSAVTLATLCVDKDGVLQAATNVNTTYGNPAGVTVTLKPVSPATATFFELIYSQTYAVPTHDCVTHTNTADFSSTDTPTVNDPTPLDNTVTVSVCRIPPITGALTIGYWQNKNGQGIINSYSGTSCQTLRTWLENFNPFQDLLSTTAGYGACGTSPSLSRNATTGTGIVGYVYNVIKAGTCTSTTNTCNTMLKAQMLATALNVYFSATSLTPTSPFYAPSGPITLGGNRILVPTAIANAGGVGAVVIDLTQVCRMIDSTAGTASCALNSYRSVTNEFGGHTCLQVIDMLYYMNQDGTAFSNGNPVSNVGGTNWYAQTKTKQVNAKDAFDSINNRVALAC